MERIKQLVSQRLIIQLLVSFLLFMACIFGFVAIADQVFEGDTLSFDEAILTSINSHATPLWNTFFVAYTNLGGVAGVIVLTATLIGLLIYRHAYKRALFVVVAVAGAALINVIVKLFFERPRPDLWEQLVLETSFSFPSGHAMASAALAFALVIVCWQTRFRWAAIIIGSFFMITIGFSRLYLGVHYPTDVLAGWLVSGAWVWIAATIVYSKSIRALFTRSDAE